MNKKSNDATVGKRKNLAIITPVGGRNYGTNFQAFALEKTLELLCGGAMLIFYRACLILMAEN